MGYATIGATGSVESWGASGDDVFQLVGSAIAPMEFSLTQVGAQLDDTAYVSLAKAVAQGGFPAASANGPMVQLGPALSAMTDLTAITDRPSPYACGEYDNGVAAEIIACEGDAAELAACRVAWPLAVVTHKPEGLCKP